MSVPELGSLLPALLDVLGYLDIGVMIIADRNDNFERWYANEPAAAIFGYTVEELSKRPAIEDVPAEHRPHFRALSVGFRAGKPVPPAMELVVQKSDGTQIPIEVTLAARQIPIGICVMVIRDVKSQTSLLEADRIGLVGALSAGFAHEINNPLTSMLLNLRSLRKQLNANLSDRVQSQARRCLDDITTGAERIASNVRALQTLATRSATGSVDLAAIVSSALRLVAPTIEPRANVIRQLFPVRPVNGEESRIGQAVLAMMLFSGSGFDSETTNASNRIVVCVEERGDEVVVEVSDNGRELTAEEARSAFDPFFRSSVRGAGVGVGLGVARSVATALGGSVTLAPRPGGGAVITMRLPSIPN